MKIKAKYYNTDVTIVGFASALETDVKVVFVYEDGTFGSCYLDDSCLTIIDKDYLPKSD